jgi:WXG100 family type VII secretion target
MPSPRIRADYEQLQKIATSFSTQAANSQRTLKQVKSQMDILQRGDWIGRGARAFYKEMDQDVLPALQRLVKALERASQVTQQISRIVKEAEDEAARLLRGAGVGAGAGARTGAGPVGTGGDSGPGAGGAGSGLPGWWTDAQMGVKIAGRSLRGLAGLISAAAQRPLAAGLQQMAAIFARGGEEALGRAGIHEMVARLTSNAARAENTAAWIRRGATGLRFLGAGMTTYGQFETSSAESLAGQVTSAGLAGGASLAVSPNPYWFAGDVVGYALGVDRPSQIIQGSIDTIVTTGEGLITGSTRGMESIHQRNLSGANGWVFQQAAEAGNFWAEHGVGGGLKMFWNEVTGLF